MNYAVFLTPILKAEREEEVKREIFHLLVYNQEASMMGTEPGASSRAVESPLAGPSSAPFSRLIGSGVGSKMEQPGLIAGFTHCATMSTLQVFTRFFPDSQATCVIRGSLDVAQKICLKNRLLFIHRKLST